MANCLECSFYINNDRTERCSNFPLKYIGYNSNNIICQECKKYPLFPDDIFYCDIILNYNSSICNIPCSECEKKDNCQVSIKYCQGLKTEIISPIGGGLGIKQGPIDIDPEPDPEEINPNRPLSDGQLDYYKEDNPIKLECQTCPRYVDDSTCLSCTILLSNKCEGLNSETCRECPRLLDCKNCEVAWVHFPISDLADDLETNVVLDEVSMSLQNTRGGLVRVGEEIQEPINIFTCPFQLEQNESITNSVEIKKQVYMFKGIETPVEEVIESREILIPKMRKV